MARNRGISTGEFIERHTEGGQGAALKFVQAEDGTTECEFLGEQGCTVHADRPLACRLYPLARWTAGPGVEAYAQVDPEPGSLGTYEGPGTVGDYIGRQVVERHFEAAQMYLDLYMKLAQVAVDVETGDISADSLPEGNWLDVDAVVAKHCSQTGIEPPADVDEVAKLHVQIVSEWLDSVSPPQADPARPKPEPG